MTGNYEVGEAGKDLRVIFRFVLLFACSLGLSAQTAPPTQNHETIDQQRKTSEPYTGDLSVFESPGRDKRLQIDRVMDTLGIRAGKSVADIGAGSG
jgi:hypothetical protein